MNTGIVCAGHIIVDIVKSIDSWPGQGMLVSIESEQQHGGGLVYNCLCDLAKLDPQLNLHAVGVVGDDQYGKYVTAKLAEYGVDCSHISVLNSSLTSFTDVMNVRNGQRTFFHMEGANAKLDIEHIIDNNLSPRIFHLGYLALLKTLDKQDEECGTRGARVLKHMRERGCKTSLDLVSVEHLQFKQIVSAAIPYTDYLIINEVEAGMATGCQLRKKDELIDQKEVQKAAAALFDSGVNELVAIHFPEGGYGQSTSGEKVFVPSFAIEKNQIMGTVGAGDAFCAGVLYGLHQGFSLNECIRFANGVARFSLMHETSTDGVKSVAEILAFVETGQPNKDCFGTL